MSGPSREDQLYWIDAEQWNRHRIEVLRNLADRAEDGYWADRMEDGEFIAQLFRAKADKLEAAFDLIDAETHDDFEELVKAAQYVAAGDYRPEKLQDAWDEYGEK